MNRVFNIPQFKASLHVTPCVVREALRTVSRSAPVEVTKMEDIEALINAGSMTPSWSDPNRKLHALAVGINYLQPPLLKMKSVINNDALGDFV